MFSWLANAWRVPELRRPEDVARIRGKQISDVLPWKPAPAPEEAVSDTKAPEEA